MDAGDAPKLGRMAHLLSMSEPPPPTHGPFHSDQSPLEPIDPSGQHAPFYPLNFGRIVQLGWSMFKFRWRQMLLAAALVLVPAYVVTIPVSAAFSPIIDTWITAAEQAARQQLPQPALPDGFETAVVAMIAITLVLVLASLVASAAIVRVVDATYRGEQVGGVDAARFGAGRLVSLAAGQLLLFVAVAVVVMLGMMVSAALIVGGGLLSFLGLVALVGTVAAVLFIAVRASLLVQTITIEGVGGSVGFGRSWRVVSGAGWRVFGYAILVALAASFISGLVGAIAGALLNISTGSSFDSTASSIVQAAIVIMIAPLGPILMTLLYYDLRWQHGEKVPVPGGDEVSGPAQPDARQPTLR